MSDEKSETVLQRALREKAEQEALRDAVIRETTEKPPAAPPVLRTVQIVLTLSYDVRGVVVRTQGACQGMNVLDWANRGEIGRAAKETLRLGGLLALVGRS